jgi:hypothetical protein
MGVFERFVFLTSILEGQIPVGDANKRKALAKNSASTMPIVMRDELCRARTYGAHSSAPACQW